MAGLSGGVAAHMRACPDEEHGPADPKGQHNVPPERQVQPGIDSHPQRQVSCAISAIGLPGLPLMSVPSQRAGM